MHVRPIRRSPVPVWIAVLAGTVGCSIDSQPDAEWDGVVSDSAGVQIVQNFGAPLWTEENRWTVSEVLKIGTVEGEPEYQFGDISGIGALSDGRIAVSDNIALHIRFFSPEGVYERTVGRQGSGPGEYAGELTVFVSSGDTLLVLDRFAQRANRIAPDGTWLDSFGTVPDDGFDRGWDAAPNGRIVSHRCCTTGIWSGPDFVVERDLAGRLLDTLAWLPSSQARPRINGQLGWVFYAGEPDIALCADGSLVTGRGDRYRLHWYDSAGNLERIVTLERPNVPFTEQEQFLFAERGERLLLESGTPPANIALMKTRTSFTDTYPAFVEFGCGPRRTLWVTQVRPLSSFDEEETVALGWYPPAASVFDVFDREGRFLGEVTLPKDFLLMTYRGDNLYGRWTDDLGVHHVMVLKIEGLPPLEEG